MKFVVGAKQHQAKAASTTVLTTTVAAAWAAVVCQYMEDKVGWALAIIGGFMVLLIGLRRFKSKDEVVEVSLSVNQLSVQLSTYRNGRSIGHPVLIPRNVVIDVVVNEVILSHKVVSVVILRLLKSAKTKEARQPIQTLLQDDKVRLEVAFPGVELSYMDCIRMRWEISQALCLMES